jgi:hypothetical protein
MQQGAPTFNDSKNISLISLVQSGHLTCYQHEFPIVFNWNYKRQHKKKFHNHLACDAGWQN